MKVMLLADNLWAGGKERRLMALIKGFSGYQDIDLHLVVFSDRIHFKEVFDQEILITVIKRKPKKNPLVFYRLYKLCRDWKPNIIHSWSSMSTIFAIPSCLLQNIKLINGNIADAPSSMKFCDKRLIRAKLTFPFSTVVVGNSLAGLNAYKVPKNKRVCIYNGFDSRRIENLESKKLIRDSFQIKTKRVVGMVGSFNGNKDYETYVETAIRLFEKRSDVTFVAVGDGKDLTKYEQMIPNKFKPRFIFTGLQTNVESIINIFDIGVLSTYTEGISNAILEYMALGKPVIATLGGGTVETIEDGITGFLIPPHSPEEMINKINYILDNDADLIQFGLAGKSRVDTVFGLQKMMKAYYELYQT